MPKPLDTAALEPCPKGQTDYEACFAPFRYCPVEGCGRAQAPVPGERWQRIQETIRAAKAEFDTYPPEQQAELIAARQRADDAAMFIINFRRPPGA